MAPKKKAWAEEVATDVVPSESPSTIPESAKKVEPEAVAQVGLKLPEFWIPSCKATYPIAHYDFQRNISETDDDSEEVWVPIRLAGRMHLLFGGTNTGKSFIAGSWYDLECSNPDCLAKFESLKSKKVTECPVCKSPVNIRPITFVDFELGRAESLKKEQYSHKNILITEVRVLKTDYNPLTDDDVTDELATEARLMQFLLTALSEIQAGKYLPSAIVVDSATDVWSIIQEWGLQQLIRYHPKYSEGNAKMMRTELQIDWKIPNKRHFKLIQICRSIMRYGVDIIWTAKYEGTPAYIEDSGEKKIRCNKDVEFYSDIQIGLDKKQAGAEQLYNAWFKKLGNYETPTDIHNKITWAKIQGVYAIEKLAKEAKDAAEADTEEVEVVVVM
jgi:hypothetical protein